MQYTENYQYRKPVIGVDIADIKDMNFNSDRTDALIHNTQISLAPAYDLNETYNTGDVVMYETLMYKCKEDNVTGVWVPEKWERTTAGEEGAGGGGTSVVPNPQGEPTDTLNTIGIDGTIFDIAGSGGGGTGEGSFYKETTLWSGSDSATMTLSESFKDYDAIMVVAKTAYNNTEYSMSSVWLTSYLSYHINDGMRFGLTGDSWYIYFSITDETTFAKQDQYYLYISEIKGLKFGGGKATRIDLLWDYVNDNSGNIYWSGNALTLNGDIRNYDEVVVEIVSAQGDVSNQWKSSYQWRLLVDPLINSFEPSTFTICSYDQRSAKFQFTNTTLQKLLGSGSENGVIRVYGVTYGGGSSGGGYSETDLFVNTGSSNPASIVMADSIQNYDEIVFKTTRNAYGNTYKLQYRYLTSELELGDQIQCWCWGPNNEYFSYVLTAFDTFSNMAQGNALLCTKIIGIKY